MTTVADVGEFGLIARLTARLPPAGLRDLGPGDDAAVLRTPDGRVVASVDMLVEGRHFDRTWSTGYDVGRKAAAANIADISAMGATASALLVGLACPGELPVSWVEALVDGLADEASLVGAGVEGGDCVASPLVCLSITALGDLAGRAPVTRSGARPGDLVVLVGLTGVSAAGLAMLRANRGAAAPGLVGRHLRPQPPYAAGPLLAECGATAMIDVSDGLLADLGHVCEASGVAIELWDAALAPAADVAAAAESLGADARTWVLTGGEDHCIAATVPRGWTMPGPLVDMGGRIVGRVTEGSGVRVDGGTPAGPRGWDHFAR